MKLSESGISHTIQYNHPLRTDLNTYGDDIVWSEGLVYYLTSVGVQQVSCPARDAIRWEDQRPTMVENQVGFYLSCTSTPLRTDISAYDYRHMTKDYRPLAVS